MTETQLTAIRNYLLSKKLPIDILIEVNDHFVSQINDLQKEEHLGFEEAFEKTKENWKQDLTLSWNGSMDLEDTTPFLRGVREEISKQNLKISIKFTLLFVLLIIFSGLILNQFFFKYFITLFFSVFIAFPFLNYFTHFKDFRLFKKYDNYILTLHQTGTLLFFSIFALVIQFIRRFWNHSEEIQKIILFKKNIETWNIFLLFIGTIILILTNIFCIISQRKYLQQIQKVKPFLKYL